MKELSVRVLVERYSGKRPVLQQQSHIWTTHRKGKLRCTLHFKEAAIYVFHLFAKPNTDTSHGNYARVFTSTIDVPVPQDNCSLFPLAYEEWKESYELVEPLHSPLPCDAIVPFKVRQ